MESGSSMNLGRYAKLCYLVIELGTEAMRQYFQKLFLPPGLPLNQFLSTNRTVLEDMLSKRKLNKTQYDLLFPVGSLPPPTDLKNFDITLLFSLIRELHPKNPDVPKPKSDIWNNLQTARSSPNLPRPILDLIEIKFYRNSLAHSKSVDITDDDFKKIWQSISISVLNLGVTKDQLETAEKITIDPKKEQDYIAQLIKQEREEHALKQGLHTRIRRVEHLVTALVILFIAASIGMTLKDTLPARILSFIELLQFGITDPGTMQVVSRFEWGAREASGPMDPLSIPVKYVIIAHTVSGSCESQEACSAILKGMQARHMTDRGWSDIAYNYHIADDGRVYEGRGPSIAGSHTKGWNLKSWGIAFMGDFSYRLPSPRALWTLKVFLKNSVTEGLLDEDYILLGHCQVAPFASPGDTLYRELKTWDHWKDMHA